MASSFFLFLFFLFLGPRGFLSLILSFLLFRVPNIPLFLLHIYLRVSSFAYLSRIFHLNFLKMGRQKQAKPLQRAPSSSQMHDALVAEKSANGSANVSDTNGSTSVKAATALEPVADTPGLMQLFICVLGIYAAL